MNAKDEIELDFNCLNCLINQKGNNGQAKQAHCEDMKRHKRRGHLYKLQMI